MQYIAFCFVVQNVYWIFDIMQNNLAWRFFLILAALLLYISVIKSQNIPRKINWKINSSNTQISSDSCFLSFENAHYNWEIHHLPIYFEKIQLNKNTRECKASLSNTVFENVTEREASLISKKGNLSADIIVDCKVGYDQKIPQALISFIPIRKNPQGKGYQKLISFDLILWQPQLQSYGKTEGENLRTYSSGSVLATGSWYRIGVTADGIHKLSYSFLKNMGMDMENIDPRNIRIYGNGGGMLPLANSAERKDDLTENAIFVQGEIDGKFDSLDYVLFYGENPNTWSFNWSDQKFHHQKHLYSDTTYYFITADLGNGKRIAPQSSSALSVTNTVSTFDDYAFHEMDSKNLIGSGREWYGEYFDITTFYDFTFSFPNIDVSSPVYIKADLAARNSNASTFNVTCQSALLALNPPAVSLSNYTGSYASSAAGSFTFTPTNSSLPVKVSKLTSSAIGWLNYLELNARRQLVMSGTQMIFRDVQSVGLGKISEFMLSGVSSAVQIWEVTDPTNVKLQSATITGNTLQFTLATDSLREFIAFTGNSYNTPASFGAVQNQNLHALGQMDLIIVSHPNFINEANTLANLHTNNDGLSVALVTPQQIYNEFSSGAQDISAIRDFIKMFYDRAAGNSELFPKYLLLLGDGSYNNKNKSSGNSNFIPTFQSLESLNVAGSYTSDDFYGALDDNEGNLTSGVDLVDVGIGRIPAKSKEEAEAVVKKILRYKGTGMNTSQAEGSSFGDWRNVVCIVADDQKGDNIDGNIFVSDADRLADYVDTTYDNYNIDKIYMDAYPQWATPGGHRYPDATAAFNQRVEKGALIIDYIGHGGPVGLAHERLIELSDMNGWKNSSRLPLFLTATCSFSVFDDPERTSAGEYILFNPQGGAIALLSTTRLAYQSNNMVLNNNFFKNVFVPINGKMPTMGDVTRITKSASGADGALRSFVLLGDPALTLAYPKYDVQTTVINGQVVNTSSPDTMKAMALVSVSGYVKDENGVKLSTYNGTLYPTVYDKAQNLQTLSNNMPGGQFPFKLQKNILYKGKVSVTNGDFSFSFIVPKDISYQYGFGRISYYAENGLEDASGNYENVIIGGFSNNAIADNTGPEVKLYMNDEKFVLGGTTNENPSLYAKLKDLTGINTVGNGIGHDISAVLDESTSKSIILNDYYESDLNSYKSGSIKYPFSKLSEGKHTLNLKVWDVYNNSSHSYTEFIVAPSAELALSHVLNYPNPFTTKTSFYFEHNQFSELLDVQIQIFTVSGKLVKTINTYVYTDGFRSQPIDWDGRDEYGDVIGKGVYIYRLKVRISNGSTADKIEKLVLLK